MDHKFFEICKEKSATDGNFAVAYAILLTSNNTKRNVMTGDRHHEITPADITRANKIKRYLKELGESGEFTCQQIFTECLNMPDKLYSGTDARAIGRSVRHLGSLCWCIGTRRTDKWGNQKTYRFDFDRERSGQEETSTDDLGI